MYLVFIFLLTTVLGMNGTTVKNISGEEIPRMHHYLVNEFEEPSGSSSNRSKRSRGTPGKFI